MTAEANGAQESKGDADEPGWEVDPDDESGAAVVATVGRQLRLRREAAGLKAAEFGRLIGYGEDLVYKVESGKRIPRPEYLDRADSALKADGLIAAMKKDVEGVRYPKEVRDLAKLEARAVEIGVYSSHGIHGLLQTEGHARVLLETRQPPYSQDEVERGWRVVWPGAPYTTAHRFRLSASSWKRWRYGGPSEAQWSGAANLNAFWK